MIAFCTACAYCVAPLPGHLMGPGSGTGLSPGQLEAARELMQMASERRAEEERRVNQDYRFDYEPHFHAWCRKFTPDAQQVTDAFEHLMKGDHGFVLQLQESGLDFVIDAPNGKLKPVYSLCEQKNRDGNCRAFRAR